MSFLIIFVLAMVQGITEFLPISSSGHLVLLYRIFGIEDNTILLSVILHLATLLAVLLYYRKDIVELAKHPLCPTNIKIVITTIVTGTIALLLKSKIETAFGGRLLGVGFMVTAIILFATMFIHSSKSPSVNITHTNISYSNAILIGLAQGLACFPAISRSGSTIACGLIEHENKEDITKFSFLISIPIIILSTIMEIVEYLSSPTALPFGVLELILGFVITFVVGLIAIKLMTKIVKNQKLYYFSFYLLILAILTNYLL